MNVPIGILIGFFVTGIVYTLYRCIKADIEKAEKQRIFNEEAKEQLDLFMQKAKG